MRGHNDRLYLREADVTRPGPDEWAYMTDQHDNTKDLDFESAPVEEVAEARSSLEEFTDRHDLSGLIELGSNLASGCFELNQPAVARMTTDQDTGEEWVELAVSAKGDVPRVRKAHRTYTLEWLKAVPLEKGLMVRLAISIV